jgi:glucoamylase
MLPRRLLFALATMSALAACAAESDEVGETEDDLSGWEPVSLALGNPPNFAQAGNGSTMSVVSRSWGRGAKAGALVELYYPHYAADNLWDSYVGLKTRGTNLRWAHDLTLKKQRLVPDTGVIVSEFEAPGLALTIEDLVRPKNDAHVRHVTVRNTGTRPLEDVDVAFYAYYTIGNFPGGDKVRYDAGRGAFVQFDKDAGTAIATVADRAPSVAHCGAANWAFGREKDARMAAEWNQLEPCTDGAGPALAGVNGVLMHRLPAIAPGQKQEINYAIGLGPDENKALAEATGALPGGFAARAQEDAAHWASVLARAPLPARLPADARDIYKRAVITVMQHRVDNGAFIAAPTLTSPVYKLVWPRDGSKTAVDMLEAGFAPEAKSFFELLEKLIKSDGSFSVNYLPDASGAFFDFGASGNENDQPGMLAWGVNRVFEATGDVTWTRARWPAVKRVAEHLLAITGDGLVKPSRDLWELETGSSWTYASGSAVAGLEASAKIARASNAAADAARYEQRAAAIRAAMGQRLVTRDGFFGRGSKNGRVDERLEIANLALGAGGFELFPDTDPRVAKIGDLVAARLGTPGGAVRRYEGDRYYGGQPWPVASVWLSIHRLARGDRAGAEALFRVMTTQARATDTLMLGEQFDEKKKAWLSAIPLVWSEAAYIRNAQALYAD